jgi:hypothetical protein
MSKDNWKWHDRCRTGWLHLCLFITAQHPVCATAASAALNLPAPNSAIYARAAVHFTNALFYKPSERDAEQLSFKLAPLLIQEAPSPYEQSGQLGITNAPARPCKGVCRVGALMAGGSRAKLDLSRPTIYFYTDAIQIKDKTHARFAYFWCSGDPRLSTYATGVQGVRLTLDSSGRPVIWEILRDPSGLDVIFIAESVDAAARAQFGPPVPGRKYAVERSPSEAAKTVVARVVDDGPMPMGPILYLADDVQTLATLICRCMPAQATTLLKTATYELRNADLEPARALLDRVIAAVKQPVFRVGQPEPSAAIEKRLRLPDAF